MKFDLPKGAVVLANFAGIDEDGKRMKKEWRAHRIIDVGETTHDLFIDVGRKEFTRISFASVRIDSYVMDHTGEIVMGRFKLKDAAQEIYSAKPLWWASKENRHERAATVLEVWLYKQDFVPYAGWRLVDFEDDSDVRPEEFKEKIWRTPIKLTRSAIDAKEEYFDEKRLAEIQKYEALYKEAKALLRNHSKLVTQYRLKLATLKRMR